MVCTKCGYRFRIDPQDWKSGFFRLNDKRFLDIVRRTNANGTRYITEEELYTAACHPRYKKGWGACMIAIGVVALFIFTLLIFHRTPEPLVGLLIALAGLFFIHSRRPFLKRSKWDEVVKIWLQSGGEIQNLIRVPSLHDPPPQWKEPDIYDYGFERLLICDDRLTVDWLVFNGLHTQERALILSEDGYPDYLLDHARKSLEENPELPVFLLHAASTHGVEMADRIRSAPHFPLENQPVTDLGVHPSQIKTLRLPRERVAEPDALPAHGLPYAPLAALLPYAFLHGVALQDAAAQLAAQGDSGSSSFG